MGAVTSDLRISRLDCGWRVSGIASAAEDPAFVYGGFLLAAYGFCIGWMMREMRTANRPEAMLWGTTLIAAVFFRQQCDPTWLWWHFYQMRMRSLHPLGRTLFRTDPDFPPNTAIPWQGRRATAVGNCVGGPRRIRMLLRPHIRTVVCRASVPRVSGHPHQRVPRSQSAGRGWPRSRRRFCNGTASLLRLSLPVVFPPYIWLLAWCSPRFTPQTRSRLSLATLGFWLGCTILLPQGVAGITRLQQAKTVSGVLTALGQRAGYGDYWTFKQTMFETDYAVHCVQLDAAGRQSHFNYNSA